MDKCQVNPRGIGKFVHYRDGTAEVRRGECLIPILTWPASLSSVSAEFALRTLWRCPSCRSPEQGRAPPQRLLAGETTLANRLGRGSHGGRFRRQPPRPSATPR